MRTITREALIERLTELEPRTRVEPAVTGAIEAMGWEGKEVFNGAEVIALGTMMAELARHELAASADPAHRRAAAEIKPLVQGMKDDVLPVLTAARQGEDA